MNYLAHLFLSESDAESLAGNLAGDFVKGSVDGRFTAAIRAGIRQHRRLDAFTDRHPAVSRLRAPLLAEHRHFSRIIGDVFIDHFLSVHWGDFSAEPLETFVARVHTTLDTVVPLMPDRLRAVYPILRREGWLLAYRDRASVERILARLSLRLSRTPHLETAARHLDDSRDVLEPHFREFFRDVIAEARTTGPEVR